MLAYMPIDEPKRVKVTLGNLMTHGIEYAIIKLNSESDLHLVKLNELGNSREGDVYSIVAVQSDCISKPDNDTHSPLQ